MTFEKRLIAGLNDIKSVSYECKKCKARITFAPEKTLEPQHQCFQCQNLWQPIISESSLSDQHSRESPFYRFIEAIAYLRNPDVTTRLGFRVVLEFEEPTQSISQTSEQAK